MNEKVTVGDLVGCLADKPVFTCDDVLKLARK